RYYLLRRYRSLPVLPSFPTRRSSDLFSDRLKYNGRHLLRQLLAWRRRLNRRLALSIRMRRFFLLSLAERDISAFAPLCPIAKSTDRKSTRLNSSHVSISYAVFSLRKK